MNDTDDMDYAEFIDTGTNLVNGIMGRIPERWRDGFANDIADGIQWPDIFMRELILLLQREQVPITPAERDTVVRLMRHRKMDLAPAEQFNVTDTPLSHERTTEHPEA